MRNNVVSPIIDKIIDLPDFPSFEAFAHSLWRKEAAVMVGAGFSRACNRDIGSPIPPLWGDFKKEMAAALGYDEEKSPDALRLAQEYQTLHGDGGLDQLIGRLVANEQWEPGQLHKQLMEFPWRDVLTTNWDTLLERTKPETPDRIYSCVRTIQEIAHRPQPRIVKLHGSLPSHKPFIFTEDDYRTYPVKFAPFVNLAQQVMLEHDLCLLGFSGVDPNFLAWSGWVRDTLNVSARKIRLVGVLKLSPVARSLLEKRNITPIDLAPLVEDLHPEEQHEEAIKIFFDALLALKPPSPYDWHFNSEIIRQSSVVEKEDRPTVMEIANEWKKEKNSYPGWIVAPRSMTNHLRNSFVLTREDDEKSEAQLRFAMERIWRHRIAQIWLNPQDMYNADEHYEKSNIFLTKKEKSELCFFIATEWRRFQKWDEWSCWMSRLELIGSAESIFYHSYEKGLRAVLEWDDESVLKAAREIVSDDPIWMMRRASLLALSFQYREAAELYQSALLCIRQKLLLSPKSAWLISLEGWSSLSHRISSSALNDDFYSFMRDESDETRMRLVAAKADPWDTITHLENLASERINRNKEDSEPWKLSFKSGIYTPGGTTVRAEDRDCPFYSLLEVIERTGVTENFVDHNLFSTRMETAYRAIKHVDEYDLLAFLSRYRGSNIKALDWILPRMQVACLSNNSVIHLLTVIKKRIERLVNSQKKREVYNYTSFLLQLLSRIVLRAPSEDALKTFKWVIESLNSMRFWRNLYSACQTVLESSIEALESKDMQEAITLSLHLKLPNEAENSVADYDWPEILEEFKNESIESFAVNSVDVSRINFLIKSVKIGDKPDRSKALIRLNILYRAGKLTSSQVDALDLAIWERCDNDGWPSDVQLHPWIFLELPGNKRANLLFLEKVVDSIAGGAIEYNLLNNFRAGIKVSNFNVLKGLLVSCAKACLEWKPTDTQNENFSDVLTGRARRDQATGRAIGEVLSLSILPHLDAEDLPEDIVDYLMHSEKLPHIPSLTATAFQVARLWPSHYPSVISKIRSAIASREPARVYPTYIAIDQFIENNLVSCDFPYEIKELLLHACEQRTQPGLSSTLQLLGNMIEKEILTGQELERLSSALIYILKEYRYDQNNLEVPSKADLPTVRKEVHRLSKLLCNHDACLVSLKSELENDPLPEVRFIR